MPLIFFNFCIVKNKIAGNAIVFIFAVISSKCAQITVGGPLPLVKTYRSNPFKLNARLYILRNGLRMQQIQGLFAGAVVFLLSCGS